MFFHKTFLWPTESRPVRKIKFVRWLFDSSAALFVMRCTAREKFSRTQTLRSTYQNISPRLPRIYSSRLARWWLRRRFMRPGHKMVTSTPGFLRTPTQEPRSSEAAGTWFQDLSGTKYAEWVVSFINGGVNYSLLYRWKKTMILIFNH